MRQFYLTFQNVNALRSELSWTHYRLLMRVENDTVVKYTLSEDNTQIFASKYKLYLPTEDELRRELQREYDALEGGITES